MQIIPWTDSRMQFNYIHFRVQMIFLLKLKIARMKIFFPDFFQKISNFPDFPRSSNKFPIFLDFPDRVETLY